MVCEHTYEIFITENEQIKLAKKSKYKIGYFSY